MPHDQRQFAPLDFGSVTPSRDSLSGSYSLLGSLISMIRTSMIKSASSSPYGSGGARRRSRAG